MKRMMTGVAIALLMLPSAQAQNMIRTDAIMSKLYGPFDKNAKCWVGKSPEGNLYCMKVSSLHFVNQQIYLLAVGDSMSTLTQGGAAHAESGNVGGFVLEDASDGIRVVAAGPFNQLGSFGAAPQDWRFVALNSTVRGWIGESGGTFQGYSSSAMTLLTPIRRKVVDVTPKIFVSMDDSGACVKSTCTTLEATASLEESNAPYRNLVLTVKGSKDGKTYPLKQFVSRFDAAKGVYSAPKGWPISGY